MVKLPLTILVYLFLSLSACTQSPSSSKTCDCDTLDVQKTIKSGWFNRVPKYDTATFKKDDFYTLDKAINRMLWYRDIESPDTTKFTKYWNDYHIENYRASHKDFIQFYKGKENVELAFQFGPNMDLWAFHIFVIKKIGCCFLITRSYFRHARFTYKAYAIMDHKQVDSLYEVLYKLNTQNIPEKVEYSYQGFFADNRNDKTFYIDFEKETQKGKDGSPESKKEIMNLYDFVDKRIKWIVSYGL